MVGKVVVAAHEPYDDADFAGQSPEAHLDNGAPKAALLTFSLTHPFLLAGLPVQGQQG